MFKEPPVHLFPESGEPREAQLRAGTVLYRDRGAGEPVVFVHGFMANGNLWRKVVPRLAEEFRCLAPDWPLGSHRVPMRPDADLSPAWLASLIVEFLDKLRLETAVLVGSDIGGALCQVVVAERPERVSRLVLLPSGPFSPLVFHYLDGATPAFTPKIRLRLPPAFGWAAKRPMDHAAAESYLRPAMSDPRVRRDMTKVLRGITMPDGSDAMQKMRGFHRPVLIAWPPEDRLFPFDRAVALSRAFPDARLEPLQDSFTYVSEDQPVGLASLISSFLADTAPSSRLESTRASRPA